MTSPGTESSYPRSPQLLNYSSSFPSTFPSSSTFLFLLLLSLPSPLPSPFRSCIPQVIPTPVPVPVPVPCPFRFPPHPRSGPRFNVAFISLPSPPFSFPLSFCPHYRLCPSSRPRLRSRLHFRPRLRSFPRPRSLFPVPKIRLPRRCEARVQTLVCVYECVCMLTWLHITTQSSPVILVMILRSYLPSQGGINDT